MKKKKKTKTLKKDENRLEKELRRCKEKNQHIWALENQKWRNHEITKNRTEDCAAGKKCERPTLQIGKTQTFAMCTICKDKFGHAVCYSHGKLPIPSDSDESDDDDDDDDDKQSKSTKRTRRKRRSKSSKTKENDDDDNEDMDVSDDEDIS